MGFGSFGFISLYRFWNFGDFLFEYCCFPRLRFGYLRDFWVLGLTFVVLMIFVSFVDFGLLCVEFGVVGSFGVSCLGLDFLGLGCFWCLNLSYVV